MKEKTADELFEELEEIFAEMKNFTTGIYYKQFKKLVKSILKISYKQRYKYVVICQEKVYRECKKIADYFNMKVIKSSCLPENILIVLYKEENLGGVLSGEKNK